MGIRRLVATASVLLAIAGATVVGPIAAVASPPLASAAAAHLDATGSDEQVTDAGPSPAAVARLANTGSDDISHPVGAALGMLAIGGAALGLRVARRRRFI